VTVHVLEGLTEVSTAMTKASAGKWSLTLSSPLPPGDNKFSAYATEVSGIGNGEGTSTPPVEFEVDTLAPVVTIEQPARSNNTHPTFSGTASEPTEVTVHVFKGSPPAGTATTTASA